MLIYIYINNINLYHSNFKSSKNDNPSSISGSVLTGKLLILYKAWINSPLKNLKANYVSST